MHYFMQNKYNDERNIVKKLNIKYTQYSPHTNRQLSSCTEYLKCHYYNLCYTLYILFGFIAVEKLYNIDILYILLYHNTKGIRFCETLQSYNTNLFMTPVGYRLK